MSVAMLDTKRAVAADLTVAPITGTCGAEIGGVDMTRPLDPATARQIELLIRKHKVLAFRDQFEVGPDALARFAGHFGRAEVAPHPDLPDYPGVPAVKVIVADGSFIQDTWHTDGATRRQTRWLSFLQAIDVPPFGRDTIFADMEGVFEGLSPKLKAFLADSTASHSWGLSKPDAPPVSHPIVVENPVTGRRALYVNRGYTRAIEGLHPDESSMLLEFLFRRVHIPEYHVRLSWKPGTIVIWDNQITQHYIVQDSRYVRRMHRVMVEPAEEQRP